ncbi:hypothetical protein K4K55_012291, partial [Colletotrichum sp. SAR 10_96]
MRGIYMGLGAMALASVNAWEYPFCEHDGCYRNLIDQRFEEEAKTFCVDFLHGTTTAPSAIPTDFNNCGGDIKAVSSASKPVYTPSTSTDCESSTEVSSTKGHSTKSHHSHTVPTYTPPTTTPWANTTSKPHHTKTTDKLTTSTIYTTHVETITKCPPH